MMTNNILGSQEDTKEKATEIRNNIGKLKNMDELGAYRGQQREDMMNFIGIFLPSSLLSV